jgi:hypothetical protein
VGKSAGNCRFSGSIDPGASKEEFTIRIAAQLSGAKAAQTGAA